MSTVLLDTTVASLLHPKKKGNTIRSLYEPLMKGKILALSFQSIAELWSWAEENNWGDKPLQKLNEDEAITVALRALDTAAEADTSTGGVDRGGKIFPLIKTVSRAGITTLPEEKIAQVFKQNVA